MKYISDMYRLPFAAWLALMPALGGAVPVKTVAEALKRDGLKKLTAYSYLTDLCEGIGPRLAGSEGASKAVSWAQQTMSRIGLQNTRLLPCKVPHWVRGETEICSVRDRSGNIVNLTCCALGQSPPTATEGLNAPVVMVHSLQEVQKLGDQVKGKIIFFNRPFDPTFVNQFAAYGAAADQRFAGPSLAARFGAKAVLVRSMTLSNDDVPHTGVTEFDLKGPKIPSAALSIVAADKLSTLLNEDPSLKVTLDLSCHSLPDVESADVMGEIVGSDKPNEVIVLGGHLDSWDKGRGAHDDGAGVVQGLEALRLIHALGWKPKRTIRVCLWMDEEQKGSGADAYLRLSRTSQQRSYAAIESDSGGFAPRGFGSSLSSVQLHRFDPYLPIFKSVEIDHLAANGETGADIGPLGILHTALFGLEVESQRYFDYHHSDKDTLDKVNPRELELGAIDIALLAWILANE